MVKKRFENVDVQCWECTTSQLGTKPPFICLKAGPEACETVLLLLDELGGLQPPDRRTVTLARSQRPKSLSRIRFVISAPSDQLSEMSLSLSADQAVFEFTPAGLAVFRNA